jgi:KipI family sensor histidine kinase inhibitor
MARAVVELHGCTRDFGATRSSCCDGGHPREHCMTIYAEPRLLPCGDRALSVELADEIGRDVTARVLALDYLLAAAAVPGVVETVPSYRALLVYYDPFAIGYAELSTRLAALAALARADVLPPSRTVELPCCYEDELGFEIAAAAARLGLTPEEVATLHAGAAYYVDFIGFTPGLPYLSGLPEALHIPRLEQPRVKTPPGSVSSKEYAPAVPTISFPSNAAMVRSSSVVARQSTRPWSSGSEPKTAGTAA